MKVSHLSYSNTKKDVVQNLMKFSKMIDTNVNFWGGNFGDISSSFNCCLGENLKPNSDNFDYEEGVPSLAKASTKWSENKPK